MEPSTTPVILVVDDEPGLALTIQKVLARAGYEVETAESGARGIALLGTRRFDAVLTDIFLPDVDGPQIIAATRRQQPHARIIAISGGGTYMSSPEALNIATKLGADVVLHKPFTPSALMQTLQAALRSDGGAPTAPPS